MKRLLVLILLIISINNAQDTTTFVKVGKIYCPFDNKGIIAQVRVEPTRNGMSYDGKGVVFSSGFLLSGYNGNELWANGVASSSLVTDYKPGILNSSEDDSSTFIYSVKRTDADFDSSWQTWKLAVDAGAYFYDGDNNGIYNPVDLNSNGMWDSNEDKPDLLYDETYFTVYNDAVPSDQRRYNAVSPKGIEVRQTIFISHNNSLLQNSIFIRYSLLNTGSVADTLKDVIFSLWADPDIGGTPGYGDDLVGTDTSLISVYAYNEGDDPAFGINPPAIFFTLLQGPQKFTGNEVDNAINRMGPELGIHEMSGYKNLSITTASSYKRADYELGDPNNAEEVRNYQMAMTPRDGPIDPCNWEDGEVVGEDCSLVNSLFWYSGDPVTHIGWIDTVINDQRSMLNTGTFNLVESKPVDIIVAYTVSQGTDELNSITKARETVSYLHQEYENNFSTIVSVQDSHEKLIKEFSLSQNYPNPFNPTTSIKFSIPHSQFAILKVYDILGREIKTLVNEVKSPGNYEVTFDASRLASGVYFYRLTSGSFVQTKKMMVLK